MEKNLHPPKPKLHSSGVALGRDIIHSKRVSADVILGFSAVISKVRFATFFERENFYITGEFHCPPFYDFITSHVVVQHYFFLRNLLFHVRLSNEFYRIKKAMMHFEWKVYRMGLKELLAPGRRWRLTFPRSIETKSVKVSPLIQFNPDFHFFR